MQVQLQVSASTDPIRMADQTTSWKEEPTSSYPNLINLKIAAYPSLHVLVLSQDSYVNFFAINGNVYCYRCKSTESMMNKILIRNHLYHVCTSTNPISVQSVHCGSLLVTCTLYSVFLMPACTQGTYKQETG